MTFLLLNFDSSEWDELLLLGKACDTEFIPTLSSRSSLEAYFNRFLHQEGFVVVEVLNGKVVGALCGFYSHPESGRPWYVCVLVDKDYRRKGLASKLYEHADKVLISRGELFVKCRTWNENISNQRALRKAGFYKVCTLLHDRGTGVHTLIYEKCLVTDTLFAGLKRLGVLGGMGGSTSAKFLGSIYSLQVQSGDEQDQLPIILDSATYTPDRSTLLLAGRKHELIKLLEKQLKQFENYGVSNVVIFCYSYHLVLPEIKVNLECKVLSLVEYTVGILKKKTGFYLLLSTNSSSRFRLFSDAENLLYPDAADQISLHECIYGIKRGESKQLAAAHLLDMISRYSCSGVVLGCTDLHLISKELQSGLTSQEVIDPLKTLSFRLSDEWNIQRANSFNHYKEY